MGLFDTTRTVVGASSVSLFEEENVEIMRDAILATSLDAEKDVAADITNMLTHGLAQKANSAYKYASESYTYGLPGGDNELAGGSGDDAVKVVLQDNVTANDVVIVSNVVDWPNSEFLIWDWLIANRGFNPDTGKVDANLPFDPLGDPDIYFKKSWVSEDNEITIQYTYFSVVRKYREEKIYFPVNKGAAYYHVIYQEVDAQGSPIGDEKRWFYDSSSGTYPILADVSAWPSSDNYYPFVPLRLNNQDMSRDEVADTELYKTSKKLLNHIDINMDDLCESIHENESIDDVDHAYFMFGVNIRTESKAGLKYLYEYFERLNIASSKGKNDYVFWESTLKWSPPTFNRFRIHDAGLSMRIAFAYSTVEVKAGNIGDIGDVTREVVIRSPYESSFYAFDRSSLILRKQLDDNTYSELEMFGLVHENIVTRGYGVDTTLEMSETSGNFIVPLNKVILNQMSALEVNSLMYASMHLVFNSKGEEEIEWYQTTGFQILLATVTLILVVYSLGTTSWTTFTLLGVTYTGAPAVILNLLVMIAISVGLQKLGEWSVEKWGLEKTFIGAILISVIGLILTFTGNVTWLPTAEQMLLASSALQKGVMTEIEEDLKDIAEQAQLAMEYQQEKWTEIEEADDLLDSNRNLVTTHHIMNYTSGSVEESPTDFYNRTIHTGNIGTLSLDSVSQYVDLKLELPKVTSTINSDLRGL